MTHELSFGPLEQRDAVWIFRISGHLDADFNDVRLRQKAEEIKNLDCKKLIVDIRDLHAIGSSGLSFLVELYRSVDRTSGRFVIAGPSKRIRDVIEATRLSTIFTLADDLDAALLYCAHTDADVKR